VGPWGDFDGIPTAQPSHDEYAMFLTTWAIFFEDSAILRRFGFKEFKKHSENEVKQIHTCRLFIYFVGLICTSLKL
jgi:hypothetical protein